MPCTVWLGNYFLLSEAELFQTCCLCHASQPPSAQWTAGHHVQPSQRHHEQDWHLARAPAAAQAVTPQHTCVDTPWRGESQRDMLIFHCQVLLPFQQDQCNCLTINTFSALSAWQHFPIEAVFQSLLYRFVYFKDKRGSACLTYTRGISTKKLKL